MVQDERKEPLGADAQVDPQPPAQQTRPDCVAEPALGSESESERKLPPLTPQEFRVYNRLSEKMDYFHEHFRQMYSTLHTACVTKRRPAGMTLKQFIDEGLNLTRYLESHHTIEETYLYPILARKMPEFQASSPPGALKKGKEGRQEDCELIRQHRLIHEGMDEMADYLRQCKSKECELELSVLKEKIDPWGEVLLKHLEQEVRDLSAENMRKYWTLQEMRSIPI
ncbi:uncharacterized protein B0T15DRAFT_544255 [Chaetomium strumarium]|uniref:Hemerythrin-like domain-containing protein n=1 Tax=Chaetomium strumarium TaxID=1170767 RepID=A0AAJ0GKN1_9PEZI|nr:hypothetical protein B0T15DRAFT_544255 [Chaetomium strumarium]